jgi:hypothetical protein
MAPLTLVRDLRMHLRAWERHRIRFGVICSRNRLLLCGDVFSAACVGAGAGELTALETGENGTDVSVMVADDALFYRFPYRYQNLRQGGKRNPSFLRNGTVRKALRSVTVPVRTVIISVAHIYQTEDVTLRMLVGRLDGFLRTLPRRFHYGVELQNGRYLLPELFGLLARHDATYVLNDAPDMPSLLDQIQMPQAMTADPVIIRTIARRDPEWQLGILEAVRRCVDEKKELFVYLGDGETESMEMSLMGLMELLTPDLARLSPLRRRAA